MKNIKMIACIALVLLMGAFFGVDSAEGSSSDKPANISITFGEDPLTEKNITWTTGNTSKTQAVVVVREANGGPQRTFTGTTETVSGRHVYSVHIPTFDGKNNIFQFKVHKVAVTGLKPDTKYEYFCGVELVENWSGSASFDTGIETGEFTFLYMTDPQAGAKAQFEIWKRAVERAHATFPNAKFIALAGDIVECGSSENQWNQFFESGKKVLSNLTVVPAAGNHDTDYGPHNFSKHFSFPENSHRLPDYVYSFDYGDARFLALSTEITKAQVTSTDANIRQQADQFMDAQISWLRNEVSKNPQKWNIVMFHRGIYSGGLAANTAETLFYRDKLAPVFDELSIDAVLQGHNHTFDKAFLYDGKTVQGVTANTKSVIKNKGTVYLTANTAGHKFYKKSAVKPEYLLRHAQPETQMYAGITVTNHYMKFDTYLVTDRKKDPRYDTFTIYK